MARPLPALVPKLGPFTFISGFGGNVFKFLVRRPGGIMSFSSYSLVHSSVRQSKIISKY